MPSSIPRPRSTEHKALRTHSLRALAVAARLERHHAPEGPPGEETGRAGLRSTRRTPDPAC
ncbi:hypothetical protein [Actinomadura macrotermitis]|uniref:Uncharacterized protein n=1 Tax=Actinomadura macrotermitis TaxID=2585200 RepID=A0A7K0BT20_9ACTN|nr:hypothetical protein [Actinomadura macrotermitis]MQY04186.1 hypothetical protein [Actinomadura macrotermitis]